MKIRNYACNLFVVAIMEMVLFFVSSKLMSTILTAVYSTGVTLPVAVSLLLGNGLFIIHIILCVVYMRVMKPSSMGIYHFKISHLLWGLLVGFVMNALLSLGAVFGTGMKLSFVSVTPLLIICFITIAIQCAAEEVLLRAYVPSFMDGKYSWEAIAFVSGTLFIFHHINNIQLIGFDWRFCLNVFLIGCLLVLAVKVTRNVWWAIGFHTAWNFTQEYLFGLPNSGVSSQEAVFNASNPTSNFFFDENYGNEGSLYCTVVVVIAIIVALLIMRKKAAQNSDMVKAD